MYLSLSDLFLKAILGKHKGHAVHLWTCGRGRAQSRSKSKLRDGMGQGNLTNLGTTRHCQHFSLFLPPTGCLKLQVHSVAPLRKFQRSNRGKASNFCIYSLIQELFIEQIDARHTIGRHMACPHEAYSVVELDSMRLNEHSDKYELR